MTMDESDSTPVRRDVAPGRLWALIGGAHSDLPGQREAGLNAKVVRLSWKDLEPAPGIASPEYVLAKRLEIARLRAAGFSLVLDSGLHDVPVWVHERHPDSFYVNQHGERWTRFTDGDDPIDKGDANLVFNPALRAAAARYLREGLRAFGGEACAVRVGGGRWNELGYPAARTATHPNTYWAYDANAQRESPTPGWRPGDPSPHGEARRFADWYLDALVDFQNWQVRAVRAAFSGPVMVLYPSAGLRPGQLEAAVRDDLGGSSSAEVNGELQRGHDFARQVRGVADPGVWVATTWLDATWDDDDSFDPRRWSPVKYLATLARAHTPPLALYGENTGGGDRRRLERSAERVRRHGLEGMAWYREEQLGVDGYASLADLRDVIAATEGGRERG